MSAVVYFARWVLLSDMSLVENGAVAVEDGRIADIAQRGTVRRRPGDTIVNLGDMLLMPGLINAHTHLEEGVTRGQIDNLLPDPVAIITARRDAAMAAESEAVAIAVKLGIRESLSNGITTIADTFRRGTTPKAYVGERARVLAMREIDPLIPTDESAAISETPEKTDEISGYSPYALWSLSPSHHRVLSRIVSQKKLLWSCHIAQTPDELMAFGEHCGAIYDEVTARKSWPFHTKGAPLHTAIKENVIPNNGILLHCSYADGSELSLLATRHASVVLCPQYSGLMSLREFPLETALYRGVNVCIGTEAPVGQFSADLFDELYTMRCTNPQIPAAELLKCVTINPAKALRMDSDIGSLEIGKAADIVGLMVGSTTIENILEEIVMEQPKVGLVIVAGELVLNAFGKTPTMERNEYTM